jgi:hypothetical protein
MAKLLQLQETFLDSLYLVASAGALEGFEQSFCGILYFGGNKQGPEDVEAFMEYDRMSRLEDPSKTKRSPEMLYIASANPTIQKPP